MNKNIKKAIAAAVTLSIASSFAACSADGAEETVLGESSENTVITVGANITPHSEIREKLPLP